MSKIIATIGIETHVQLKTKTKLFSAVDNDARQAKPNSLISHIDVGMPGALPVLNQKAVDLSVQAGLALGGEVQHFSKFDRKHYFYPDLPKGYQITQYDQPLIKGGLVELPNGHRVRVNRIHLEEDAGKTIHPAGADYSLVDLNRAGTPLIEIVSEPDIATAEDAKAYARELYLIMKYADVTDGDLYHGHIRFDVNISISRDPKVLGKRTEVKNLNSFRSVENAVAYEIKRQSELLEKGGPVIQETRGWDEAKQQTTSQRGKEEAQDYRYMPEPDLPPLELSEDYVSKLQTSIPDLPSTIRQKLLGYKVDKNVIEDILDSPKLYERLLNAVGFKPSPEVLRRMIFDTLENPKFLDISVQDHLKIATMVNAGELGSSAGIEALADLLNGANLESATSSRKQISDASAIEKIVQEVIKDNTKAAEDAKNGQEKVIGFLVGQVMAKSKGQANPEIAQQIIKKSLGIK